MTPLYVYVYFFGETTKSNGNVDIVRSYGYVFAVFVSAASTHRGYVT